MVGDELDDAVPVGGRQVVAQESPGYRAFKSVRPDEEPSSAVDLLYHHLYQLALGVHMAGPDLTPATLEAGLHSYPQATGPSGTWDYGPGRHTPVVDFREVWWDPELVSPFNGAPGSYRSTGQRFLPGELTPGMSSFRGFVVASRAGFRHVAVQPRCFWWFRSALSPPSAA